ncbi:MAG: hypothetical protein A2Y66_05410 [Nitrospirae bacterium RBG_13_41_22]|nr:MAG: hypothetical protein A2Y66_05410 [Nitrospirae bacterium RBG_13_41_22]
MTECAYQSCNRHIYKNSDKCILHCSKDDWFSEDTHGSRDWSNSQDKIKIFWETVRNEKMAQSDYDFNGVIFPEFEEYNSENIEEIKVNENKIYKAKGPFNFWEVDRNLIFDKKEKGEYLGSHLNYTFYFYGSLKGIAGASIPHIRMLEEKETSMLE